MQKVASTRDDAAAAAQAASLSATLKSSARPAGPRVVRRAPRHVPMPQSPRSLAAAEPFVQAVSDAGLKPVHVFHNLSPAELYEHAIRHERGSHITSAGALATLSGAKTGRSPRDKRVVRDAETEGDIWWAKAPGDGSPNYEMDERSFLLNRERAVDYLNMLDRLYVFDGFACWDPEARYK